MSEPKQLTKKDYERIIAARDAAISTAQMLEDILGTLIQVHHVGPNGEREMRAQFPMLAGKLTHAYWISDMIGKHELTQEQKDAGWQLVAVAEGSDEFVMAKK